MKKIPLDRILALFLIGLALGILVVFSFRTLVLPPPPPATSAPAKKTPERIPLTTSASSPRQHMFFWLPRHFSLTRPERSGVLTIPAGGAARRALARRARAGDLKARQQQEQEQEAREDFIHTFIKAGYFYKIETNGLRTFPVLWVGLDFYGLTFDMKEYDVSIVMDYFSTQVHDERIMIILKDSRSGKRIGKFDRSGLHLH